MSVTTARDSRRQSRDIPSEWLYLQNRRLAGDYSLSAYTPEELYVRKHLNEEQPDIVINVVDASNLERNLYLTCQLIDMDVRMVIALNMYDELERHGNKFDHNSLSRMIGTPIVPTISKTGSVSKNFSTAS